MAVKRVNISDTSSGTTPLAPLRAGQYAKRSRVIVLAQLEWDTP